MKCKLLKHHQIILNNKNFKIGEKFVKNKNGKFKNYVNYRSKISKIYNFKRNK